MSVKTTVDEKVDIASITVIEALEALTCVIVGRCWGWDELSRERKQELYDCHRDLISIRDVLGQ